MIVFKFAYTSWNCNDLTKSTEGREIKFQVIKMNFLRWLKCFDLIKNEKVSILIIWRNCQMTTWSDDQKLLHFDD